MSDDARLEALEGKLAFQEDALRELSDALIAQQTRLDRLEAWIRLIAEQSGADSGDDDDSPEPPPPHY